MNPKHLLIVALLSSASFCGCSKSEANATPSTAEAATRLENAFGSADPATKEAVNAASTALRQGKYEQAVLSLTTVRSKPATTAAQQQAILESSAAMESTLIQKMGAGDKDAEQAYRLLKELKRK